MARLDRAIQRPRSDRGQTDMRGRAVDQLESCPPGIICIIGKACFTFPIIPRTSFILRRPISESGSEPLGKVSQIALMRESEVPDDPVSN